MLTWILLKITRQYCIFEMMILVYLLEHSKESSYMEYLRMKLKTYLGRVLLGRLGREGQFVLSEKLLQ